MADIKVYGTPWCPDCKRSKKFLAEHRVPYEWIDIYRDPAALAYVEQEQSGGRTIPMIVFPDGSRLVEPGDDELAHKLGLRLEAEEQFYDLVIVGGGPAGLAAAIYAAREGVDAVVVDKGGLGRQAGVTERIDNYPGFPDGISGGELADRFIARARRYGVELLSAVEVAEVAPDGRAHEVRLRTGQVVGTHAVLVATGSSYRRLGVPGEVGSGGRLTAVMARDRVTGEEHVWHPAGAFVFIGLDPNTGLARQLRCARRVGIRADRRGVRDIGAGCVRRRRCAGGFHQAAGLGGRRRDRGPDSDQELLAGAQRSTASRR